MTKEPKWTKNSLRPLSSTGLSGEGAGRNLSYILDILRVINFAPAFTRAALSKALGEKT